MTPDRFTALIQEAEAVARREGDTDVANGLLDLLSEWQANRERELEELADEIRAQARRRWPADNGDPSGYVAGWIEDRIADIGRRA